MNREIQNLLFTIRDDTSRFKYDYGFEDDNKILIKAKIGDWIMLLEEIERLNNIIKEVREYIENNDLYEQDYDYDYEENLVVGPPSDETARKILLGILDKENK